MVQNLGSKVVIVFTDRTPNMVKDKLIQKISVSIKDYEESIVIWDSTKQTSTINKINTYESIIQNSQRIVLTADLDYACAHAASKG